MFVPAFWANAQDSSIAVEAQLTANESQKVKESLFSFKVVSIDEKQVFETVRKSPKQANLSIALSGLSKLDLSVHKDDIRAPGYKAVSRTINGEIIDTAVTTQECKTFAGIANDNPDQFVRLFIDQMNVKGVISDGKGGYFCLEPIATFTKTEKKDNRYILYHSKDIVPTNEICGVKEVEKAMKGANGRIAAIPVNCRILEVATDADWEYFQNHGGNSYGDILNVMNIVHGVYLATFNIRLMVVYQHVYTSQYDPYTTTNSDNLLDELKNNWNSLFSGVGKDHVHLFTGKSLDDGTLGIAFTSTTCDSPFKSYGISMDRTNVHETVAHEIGHTLGASHPTDAASGCGTASRTIMCQGTPKMMNFSAFSQNEIGSYLISNSSCLFDLAGTGYLNIFGPLTICSSGTYTVDGVFGGTITSWSSNNTSILTINSSGVATRVGSASGHVTITATVSICDATFNVSRQIHVGVPTLVNPSQVLFDPNSNMWQCMHGGGWPGNTYYWSVVSGSASLVPNGPDCYVTTSGGATIALYATNECGTSSTIYYNIPPAGSFFKVYPNPAHDVLTIQFISPKNIEALPEKVNLYSEKSSIAVISVDVKEAYGKNEFEGGDKLNLNVKNLPRGIYYLHIIPESNQNQEIQRVRILLE
ncbi:hypothetical protein GCM10028803_53510 [Larkinella knui]